MECGYKLAWQAPCKRRVQGAGQRCSDHEGLLCASCGAPATRECDETWTFVCGFPLCDDCEHATYEDGTNGGIGFNQRRPPEGMGLHVRKSGQKFTPWYTREEV